MVLKTTLFGAVFFEKKGAEWGQRAKVAKLFLILFCHSLPLGLGGVNELSLEKKKKKKAGLTFLEACQKVRIYARKKLVDYE